MKLRDMVLLEAAFICVILQSLANDGATTLKMPGRAIAFQSADIMAPVSGMIVEQRITNGSKVGIGDVLFRLNDEKARANVARAEAHLEALKVQYSISKGNYERRNAVKQGVSKESVETSFGTMEIAKARVKEAEVALASAKSELAGFIVRSPIDGVAGSASKGLGSFVSVASGPLINISTISPIRVKFALSNANFLRLFDGDCSNAVKVAKIRLTLADGRLFPEEGRIEYVENVVDPTTDSIRMYASFQNKDMMLRPGSSVTVELIVSKGK